MAGAGDDSTSEVANSAGDGQSPVARDRASETTASRSLGNGDDKRPGRIMSALGSVGPFAVALTAYGLALDHLPESWFSFEWLRYAFAGLGALCVGLALRVVAQLLLGSRSDLPGPLVAVGAAPMPEPTKSLNPIGAKIEKCAALVSADLRTTREGAAQIVGWSQYLGDDVAPTAIGSSYGLRLALELNFPHSAVDRYALVQSLLLMQKRGGGWAASTQRDVARPEVTAWVLSAICRSGLDADTKQGLVNRLESIMELDSVGLQRTTVVSVVLATLTEVAPQSPMLRDLVRRLLDGGSRQEIGMMSWGDRLDGDARNSVPHTARAIVALRRSLNVVNDEVTRDAVAAGIRWLCHGTRSLRNVNEQIRRPVRQGTVDVLLVGHFTAAWVARAVVSSELDEDRRVMFVEAIRQVVASQERGIWKLDDGLKPIWMAYQGVVALKDYALSGLRWPP